MKCQGWVEQLDGGYGPTRIEAKEHLYHYDSYSNKSYQHGFTEAALRRWLFEIVDLDVQYIDYREKIPHSNTSHEAQNRDTEDKHRENEERTGNLKRSSQILEEHDRGNAQNEMYRIVKIGEDETSEQ